MVMKKRSINDRQRKRVQQIVYPVFQEAYTYYQSTKATYYQSTKATYYQSTKATYYQSTKATYPCLPILDPLYIKKHKKEIKMNGSRDERSMEGSANGIRISTTGRVIESLLFIIVVQFLVSCFKH